MSATPPTVPSSGGASVPGAVSAPASGGTAPPIEPPDEVARHADRVAHEGVALRPARRRGRAGWLLVAVGLLGALAGAVVAGLGAGGGGGEAVPLAEQATDAPFGQLRQGAAPVPDGRSPVARVEVPALDIGVEVRPVAAREDGVLLPPSGTVGWWDGGASPLADTGTVVVVGHVNTPGGGVGVFGRLDELPEGSTVSVTAADGTVRAYVTGEPRSYRASALPEELFTTEGPPQLALVTCALPYDVRLERWTRTTVVWAEPAGVPSG